MNSLQRFCAGFLLTLALTLPAFAGEIPCGVTAPPPPPPQETTETPGEAGDVITEALASLLSGLLTIL